jgi:hypothetical protein
VTPAFRPGPDEVFPITREMGDAGPCDGPAGRCLEDPPVDRQPALELDPDRLPLLREGPGLDVQDGPFDEAFGEGCDAVGGAGVQLLDREATFLRGEPDPVAPDAPDGNGEDRDRNPAPLLHDDPPDPALLIEDEPHVVAAHLDHGSPAVGVALLAGVDLGGPGRQVVEAEPALAVGVRLRIDPREGVVVEPDVDPDPRDRPPLAIDDGAGQGSARLEDELDLLPLGLGEAADRPRDRREAFLPCGQDLRRGRRSLDPEPPQGLPPVAEDEVLKGLGPAREGLADEGGVGLGECEHPRHRPPS